jgi:hypothetical protein
MLRIHTTLIAGATLAVLAATPANAGGCCVPPVSARPTVIAAPVEAAPILMPVAVPAPIVAVSEPVPLYKVDHGPYYDGPGTDYSPRFFHENQPVRDFPYVSTVAPWVGEYPVHPRHRPWRRGWVRSKG